jgi:hypothetical protein
MSDWLADVPDPREDHWPDCAGRNDPPHNDECWCGAWQAQNLKQGMVNSLRRLIARGASTTPTGR